MYMCSFKHASIHVHVGALGRERHTCTYAHTCRDQKSTPTVIPQTPSIWIFETKSLIGLELAK